MLLKDLISATLGGVLDAWAGNKIASKDAALGQGETVTGGPALAPKGELGRGGRTSAAFCVCGRPC